VDAPPPPPAAPAPPPATKASDAPADGTDPWLAEMDAAENGGAK